MLERFTEKAQRAVHSAFMEAQQHGDTTIGPIYLVLGLAQANPEVLERIGIGEEAIRKFRATLPSENPIVPSAATTFPFGAETRAIIARAAKEADSAGKRPITSGHLLLGMYFESSTIRNEIEKLSVTEDALRKAVLEAPFERMRSPEYDSMVRRQLGRPGIGYDLHRLEAGRKLMIGGVHVPFDKGPVGHSDGDVLAHAICDALLGATGMGDIGTHFPDTDPRWKGANSLIFLEHLRALFENQGLQIIHIDAVVITERPKLGPHFPAMREALAKALGIEMDQINLKAKTNEGVDAIGRGEAIAAHVVATVAG
jgi:2-C-methyl-D-erythritol 2,4-cyclodiphosphate synthase